MKRNIERHLLDWKHNPERKALLVRGARQVGKTYSIRKLGKTFEHFIEINFEENPQLRVFFNDSLEPTRLCEKLAAYFSIPIVDGKTLLFFDEIQSCPEALVSLRFFYEKRPALHVVGAGSLLEFALEDIPSLGVGRLSSLFMYPLAFDEYLSAAGEDGLIKIVEKADTLHPLDEAFHRRLIEHVKTFQLIGGLPAVVKAYAEKRDLASCFKILDDLLVTFQDDFAKYKKRAPVLRLAEVFRSVAYQSGGKFKYTHVDSESCVQSLKDALRLLMQAGLVYCVVHTHARGLPLGAQIEEKKFKALLFDMGIHQRMLGLNMPEYLVAQDLEIVNKGSLAEVFVGLELVKNQAAYTRPDLYYWHRESRGSNAEVDYVIQQGIAIVPVEVKAGTRGRMQSMTLFMKERGIEKGIRMSLEHFSVYGQIEVIPLYAVGRLVRSALKNPRAG